MTRTMYLAAVAALAAATALPVAAEAKGPHGVNLAERFAAMDADQDGTVTNAEMRAFHAARFAAADANGDGKLSVEEMDTLRKAHRIERLQRMVAWMDTDGDGLIALEEMPNPAMRPMARMDTNGDGAVSQEELKAAEERRKDRSQGGWFGHRSGHH